MTRAVKWLLIVNIGVFLLELLIGRFEGGVDFIQDHLCISFEGFFFRGQLWQPVTYMFLHDPYGIGHILWNMLILWMFGSPLESFWGPKGFLKFYFICGVGAGAMILVTGLLMESQRAIPTLGASGALFGMMVAFGFLYPNALIYLFGIFPIKGKHLVFYCSVGDRSSRFIEGIQAPALEKGLDVLDRRPVGDYAAFRGLELATAINRLRTLAVRKRQ